MDKHNNWKHKATSGDGQYCEIEGINVWDYKWQSNYEIVEVKDPVYGETKLFTHYWIQLPDKKIEFVAGEFSNGVFGFYTKD